MFMSSPKIVVLGFHVNGIDTTEIQTAIGNLSPYEIPGEYLYCLQLILNTGETFRVKKDELQSGVDRELLKSIFSQLDLETEEIKTIEVVVDLMGINSTAKKESTLMLDGLLSQALGTTHGDSSRSH
jgi:hypothetical protein